MKNTLALTKLMNESTEITNKIVKQLTTNIKTSGGDLNEEKVKQAIVEAYAATQKMKTYIEEIIERVKRQINENKQTTAGSTTTLTAPAANRNGAEPGTEPGTEKPAGGGEQEPKTNPSTRNGNPPPAGNETAVEGGGRTGGGGTRGRFRAPTRAVMAMDGMRKGGGAPAPGAGGEPRPSLSRSSTLNGTSQNPQ